MKLQSDKPKHTAREIRHKGIITQASLFWTKLSLIKKLGILTGITLLGGILGLLTGAPLLGLIGGLGFFLLIHAVSTYLYHHKIDKTKCPINESQISSELLDEAQQSSEELVLTVSNTALELKNTFNAVLEELNQSAKKPVHQQHVRAHNTTHAPLTKNHEEELNIIQPYEAELIQNEINIIQHQQDALEATMDRLLSKLLLENQQLEEYANHNEIEYFYKQ